MEGGWVCLGPDSDGLERLWIEKVRFILRCLLDWLGVDQKTRRGAALSIDRGIEGSSQGCLLVCDDGIQFDPVW